MVSEKDGVRHGEGMRGRNPVAVPRRAARSTELWLIAGIFVSAVAVNYLFSSHRLILNLYILPTIFSAYYFGRRHAMLTAVFTSLVAFLIVFLHPGVMAVGSESDVLFDLALWSGLLIVSAYTIGSLYDAKKSYIRKLRETYDGVLVILQQVITSRDKYAQSHGQRVAIIASRIAERIGLNAERIEDVRAAALLHEVGKSGVSRDVVCRTVGIASSNLKGAETGNGRSGESVGGSIGTVLPIILAHHDKFDCAGFDPTAEIPLEARIIAVADAYDSFTHERPYRKAMSPIQARDIIVRGSGTAFDPAVVRAFEMSFDVGEFSETDALIDPAADPALVTRWRI